MMYRLSVPVMNSLLTEQSREEYLRQFVAAGVDRVFLVPNNRYGSCDTGVSHAFDDASLLKIKENIEFLTSHGIEAALWVGTTIGHGGLLHDNLPVTEAEISTLVNLSGEKQSGTFCPLDPKFKENIAESFAALATTGAKLILIDDDFRLSQHGSELCCVCDRHMAEIQRLCGEPIAKEELRARAFVGTENKYRNAFMQAQGDSLRQLARVMRRAVDSVDPSIGIALCSCHCIWDIDGTDPIELTEILKGEHTPVLRLHGAPYWAIHSSGKKLPAVFEIARMFASFCKDTDFELMTEGDAYPRPRYHTPSSYVEIHDALMRADQSTHGALKYMFDYVSTPRYETGFLERHIHDLPALQEITALFADKRQIGVKIELKPHLLKDADCDLIASMPSADSLLSHSPMPSAGFLLAPSSIPTTYSGKAICRAAFGEIARHVPVDELGDGFMLDASAAILLSERGVDVGLCASESLREAFKETTPNFIMTPDHTEQALLVHARTKMLFADLKPDAKPMLCVSIQGKEVPLAYRYENADGQRFLVWLYDGTATKPSSGLLSGYLQQAALIAGIEWLADQALPVTCVGNPELYVLCAESENTLTVGLFNCYADSILHPTLELNEAYESIRFVNTSGELHGKTVTLSELGAFGFAAFEVSK